MSSSIAKLDINMENNTSNYCRLCADLKQTNDLSNMEINVEKCQEIVDKLKRFNIHVDFNNMLPKTVCLECMNSLDGAYDFVSTVILAQEAFEDYDSSLDKVEVALEDKTMDESSKDEVSSVQTEEHLPNNKPDATDKVEIKNDAKSEIEDNSTSKSKKEKDTSKEEKETSKEEEETLNIKLLIPKKVYISKKRKAKSNALDVASTQRKKPKISTDVDLDTWYDYNWLCAYCDKYFQTPSELKIHSMQYHNTCNPYRCCDCRMRQLQMDNFITHICKHRPVLSHICYRCSEKCKTLKEMKAHKSIHQDTDYICIGCNTSFSNSDELEEHTKTFYKDTEPASSGTVNETASLKCVLCKKTLKSKTLLDRHLLLHTDRKRAYVCDTCSLSFNEKKELSQHVSVHSDSRPYKCEICKFTFKTKQELSKHGSVHSGQKRFPCGQCSKNFRLYKELMVHSAIHKVTTGHKCSECNRSFRFRHLLVQHLHLHTGIKPYSCDNCRMTFRSWLNYNKHARVMHGVDISKKKRTSKRLYTVDPKTKEVVYPDMGKVMAWKKKILAEKGKSRPKRIVKKRKTVTQAGKKNGG